MVVPKRVWSQTTEAVIGEVHMQFMRFNTVRSGADVISGILNCVCPECGGRMGGRGQEFKCQGECLRDWRQTWEHALAARSTRAKTPDRGI
jgi:tRNA(Ile2) C34 agmatinyltransferase TiaS